jgi:DNA-binding transcriptional LysR family regulator
LSYLHPRLNRMIAPMDIITNLRTFLEVARASSFSAAARKLNIATSVVTKRIEQIESTTGRRLFERTTRKVDLTEAGHRLFSHAERITSDLHEALTQMREAPTDLIGPLRIKMPTTLTAFYLTGTIARFQAVHPNVTMEVLVLDRVVDPIREGFDMALSMFPTSFGGVIPITICRIRRTVVASPEYVERIGQPAHPAELTLFDTLNFQPLGAIWTFEGDLGPLSVTLRPTLNSNDGQTLLDSVLRSNGIALLSAFIVQPAIDDGRLVPILKDFPVRDFWLRALIPEERMQVPRVQAFLDFLRADLTPVPPWERKNDLIGI